MYFESFGSGPDRLMVSVRFSFSIEGNGYFLCGYCLTRFIRVLFLIQCEYGIGLKIDVSNKSTS